MAGDQRIGARERKRRGVGEGNIEGQRESWKEKRRRERPLLLSLRTEAIVSLYEGMPDLG